MDEALAGHAAFHRGRGRGRRLRHRHRQRPRHPGRSASEIQEQVRARSDHDARCMRAANSTPRSTRPRAACTASASRWSMRCRSAWRSRSRAAASSMRRPSCAASRRAGLQKLGKVNNRRGTKVRFKPDPEIFGAKAKFNPLRLFKMTRAKAYLFGGVEIRWSVRPALLDGTDDVPEEATLPFRERAGGLSQGDHRRRDAGASRHLRRQVGEDRRPRHGRMGGRLRRRRRPLPVLLLQHHPDAATAAPTSPGCAARSPRASRTTPSAPTRASAPRRSPATT